MYYAHQNASKRSIVHNLFVVSLYLHLNRLNYVASIIGKNVLYERLVCVGGGKLFFSKSSCIATHEKLKSYLFRYDRHLKG